MTDIMTSVYAAIKITTAIMVGLIVFAVGYSQRKQTTSIIIMGLGLLLEFGAVYLFIATS
jgi:hypothetical protein